jgi:hypothetical protein
MLFQTLKDLKIDPVEDTRLERIEQIAYLIVTGDVFNTKQGAGIIVPRGVLEMLLMRKKRRQWHIKDAESAQGSVFDPVLGIGPWFAMVGQLINPSLSGAREHIEV